MNKSLRQLFTIVVALFVILGMSTTIITEIRANQLNNDPRTTRALYHEYGAPRGAILASDGSVIAKSDPSNDAFSYQRSYTAGELYAPVTGFFSISQRCSPARKTRARPSKRPLIRKSSRPPTTVLPTMTARPWPSK